MPTKAKSSRSKDENSSSIYKSVLFSLIGTLIFFAVISLFSAAVLKTGAFSSSMYMPIGLVSGALSSFCAGFFTVRPVRKNGAALGALSGFCESLLCSAAIFFINGNNAGTGIFILMAVITAFGAIGGISAVNLKVKKKYK